MLRNTTIRNIIFAAISAAALSACGGGGGSSPSTELVNNATSARSVMDQINALPAADAVTVNDIAAVQQAINAYNKLGDSKSLVSSTYTDKLKALSAAIESSNAAATAVENQIAALPSEISKNDSAQVTAARTSYDALTDAQQTWVDNAEALSAAEATVTANTNKAAAIQTEIAALPTEISKADSAKVTAARADLEALTDVQETWVASDSVKTLETAEATVKANTEKAAAIQAEIAALPTDISKADAAKVTTARTDFTALTDAQETWVASDSVKALEAAEATVTANTNKANAIQTEIAALPSEISKTDSAKVTAARADLEALTDAQETWVASSSVTALETAEATVKTNQTKADAVAKQIAALPDNGLDVDTDEEVAAFIAAKKAFADLSDSEETWVDSASSQKLKDVSASAIVDDNSLTALNLPTPLATSFISSTVAQQNNPNVQLRHVDSQAKFTYDQGGLISTLQFNQNDEVKLDGVVITNNTADGSATQVEFTTPGSMIVKAFSGGVSKSDVKSQTGASNSVFETGKASFDDKIASLYTELKTAQDSLSAAQKELAKLKKDGGDEIDIQTAEENIAELEAKIPELQSNYDSYRNLRAELVGLVEGNIADIAYIKKDKNGLVFDKKFDGVYIVQFTDGTRITLHDSAAAGWTYQTFAHYVDPKNGVMHGYQSLGDETAVAAMPTSGTATYKGLTTGYLLQDGVQERQLTADVTAVADFAKKGVRFATSNSTFHTVQDGVRVSTADSSYNIKGNGTWAANSNQFSGNVSSSNGLSGKLNGKFYGTSAAEIGGTYSLQNSANTAQLIGGYGAKRQ